jgi:hypothetical protein
LAEIWRSGSRSGCGKPAFVEVAFNHLGGLSQPLCDVELKLRENPVPPKFRRCKELVEDLIMVHLNYDPVAGNTVLSK